MNSCSFSSKGRISSPSGRRSPLLLNCRSFSLLVTSIQVSRGRRLYVIPNFLALASLRSIISELYKAISAVAVVAPDWEQLAEWGYPPPLQESPHHLYPGRSYKVSWRS